MKEALFLTVLVGSILAAIGRALLIDEAKGRLQRRAQHRLEQAIAELPADLQKEWSPGWRRQFAAIIAMPFTAAQYVRAVRLLPRNLEDAEVEVERAIACLPPDRREDWADEWRAEFLATLAADPTRATEFARGLRRSAWRLGGSAIAVPQVLPSLGGSTTTSGDGVIAARAPLGRLRHLAVAAEFGQRRARRLVSALARVGERWLALLGLVLELSVCASSWALLSLAAGPRAALGVMACPVIALISFHIARWLEGEDPPA